MANNWYELLEMDNKTSDILSVAAIVVSVIGSVVGVINHKRIRSKCCGRNLEASIDVENTTPPQVRIPEDK